MRTRRTSSSSDPVSTSVAHQSVLLHEVIQALAILPTDVVLDGTLGGAGHAAKMVEKLGPKGVFIGLDSDPAALERARVRLAKGAPTVHLVQENFRNAATVLKQLQISKVSAALFDLGWSSYHLASGKGFSFRAQEPLVMTYGDAKDYVFTAHDVVNTWSEEHLTDILEGWGEERFSARIAAAIVAAREEGAIQTADQLAEIVSRAVPKAYRHGRTHPATKTFQALRIAVNDELGSLRALLAQAPDFLAPGGRLAIITFHSLEDRIVKVQFRAWQKAGLGETTKKPLAPTADELAINPRARSAKLRVFRMAL